MNVFGPYTFQARDGEKPVTVEVYIDPHKIAASLVNRAIRNSSETAKALDGGVMVKVQRR